MKQAQISSAGGARGCAPPQANKGWGACRNRKGTESASTICGTDPVRSRGGRPIEPSWGRQNGQCAPKAEEPDGVSGEEGLVESLVPELEQIAAPHHPWSTTPCAIQAWGKVGANAPSSTTQAVSQVVQMRDMERARNMLPCVKASILPKMGLHQGDPWLRRWRITLESRKMVLMHICAN